jgi:hypothetical protein
VTASPPSHYPLKFEITFCVRGVVSPTLANIYLHYTFDPWADRWRRHHARGNVVLVRYADGTPVQMSNLRGESPLIPIVRSGI